MNPSRTVCVATSLVLLAWLAVVCLLAHRFNVPSGDGLIYSLPFSAATHPFDLGIPHLDNFRGYGEAWGHNWPGSMWLRGLAYLVVPYSRLADVAVLSLFQAAAAIISARLVWRATGSILLSATILAAVLSDRLLLLACAGNRFESLAVAVVLLLFANTLMENGGGTRRWLMRGAAFLCPTLHPYALVMGFLVILHECVRPRLRKAGDKEPFIRLALLVAGATAAALWLAAIPANREQFLLNLTLQKSFYQNWNVVMDGLANYRMGGGLLLWAGGLACAVLLVTGAGKLRGLAPEWRFLAPALFLSVIAMHTVTRCENFHYLAFGTPFAAMMAAVTLHALATGWRWFPQLVAPAGMLALALPHLAVIPYRLLQFKKAGMPDMHGELSSILRDLPAGGKVFGCYLFWPVVKESRPNGFRFSTLPVASPREYRESYERAMLLSAQPGDFLIVDNATAGQPDPFGVHPTFPQTPPDPARWKWKEDRKLMFAGGSAPWGVDLSVYEFTGP